MIEEPGVTCPYCGETITIMVDTTAGSQRTIEDCFVCCQPIELTIEIGPAGDIDQIVAESDDD